MTDSIVLSSSVLPLKKNFSQLFFVVGHIIPLEGESVRWFWDVAGGKELGDTKDLLKTMRVDARRGE